MTEIRAIHLARFTAMQSQAVAATSNI